MSKYNPSTEYGKTGLNYMGGWIHEEFLNELRGDRKLKVFREMSDNDPVIGGMLFAIEKIISQVKWRVDPGEINKDQEVADFVESCRHDMSSSWDETIEEILSFLRFGFSYHEIVYKKRLGPESKDSCKRSKFTDRKIGWKKLPIRGQHSIVSWGGWDLDENGGVQGATQNPPPDYIPRYIPIEKALLFRIGIEKNNPEGRSILRNSYRPWYMKKNIENIEAVGIERDLAGLPVIWVPANVLKGVTEGDATALLEYQKIVTNLRRDEQEGLIMPLVYDENGNKKYDISLLTTGGTRTFDTNAIIMRYSKMMALTVLADFLLLGLEGKGGSLSLAKEKANVFSTALSSILDKVTEVFNRFAIPRLLHINGKSLEDPPLLAHGGVRPADLAIMGKFITDMVNTGVIEPDENLSDFARKISNIPTPEK